MTTQPKWTPGPWKAGRDGYISDFRADVAYAMRTRLSMAEAECEANAKLIAAAPDMARVLFEIAEALARESDDAESAEDSNREAWASALCKQIRAVLAKAGA